MKTTIFKYLLTVPFLFLGACENYLDITPKGKVILTTVDEYGKLLDDPSAIIYNVNDITYLNDDEWLSPMAVNNAMTGMDLGAANFMYLEAFNGVPFDRSENAYNNSGNSPTFYQDCYSRISKIANIIIDNISTMEGAEDQKKILEAQAKLLRAYNYFVLVNFYAKHYDKATAATDGAVALRTTSNMEETVDAKVSVARIYEQIEKDIQEGLPDLPETAVTPFRFNKAAGYALKAKVHLFKKEFDLCEKAALESYTLNSNVTDLTMLVDPATHLPKTALWATEAENLYFASTALPNPGYYTIGMDLINLYLENGDNDMRFALYNFPSGIPADNNDAAYQASTNFTNRGVNAYAYNGCGLRTSEVMLMLAECYARAGQYDKVKQYLIPLLQKRILNFDPATLVIPNNVTDAVKFVLKERRKELTMGFNRFFDLRRLNTEPDYAVAISRTVPANPNSSYLSIMPPKPYSMQSDSPLYVLPFPQKVLDNDPRLTSNTNN